MTFRTDSRREDEDMRPSGLTRRAALSGIGTGAAGAVAVGALLAPGVAQAASGGIYVVVSADGTGDYTDLEAAVAQVPAGSTIFVKRGTYTLQNGNMRPAPGVRIL